MKIGFPRSVLRVDVSVILLIEEAYHISVFNCYCMFDCIRFSTVPFKVVFK